MNVTSDQSDGAPLSGIRVIEIGSYMAVPFAGMHLADLGADVIKIEEPGRGDPVREVGPFLADEVSSPFIRLNRNKRSVALDLRSDQDRAALHTLIGSADVVLENLRPGALRQLGLGYEDMAELNPRLVYASASGWGQDGPLAHLPGFDIMAQARSGLMSVTGETDGPPAKVGVPICDLVCALYVTIGVLAALRARAETGRGDYVDVSLYEAGISFGVWEASRFFVTGEAGRRSGNAHQTAAPYQAFPTADGEVTIGAITRATWQRMCEALGLSEMVRNPDYETAYSRFLHRDSLIPELTAVTRRYTSEKLIATLDAASVPCAPIRDTAEVFGDPDLTGRGFFWESSHPAYPEKVAQIGSPIHFTRARSVRRAAGPPLGHDTAAVLREVGVADSELEDILASQRQLELTTPS